MADKTHIEWTDATWNPITGCSVVSPGCTNCYAMKLAGTRLKHHSSREGLTTMSKAGPVWNGEVRFNEQWLDQPLRWQKPRMIFVCAHGDLFHENVPDYWIDKVFAVMALAPHHTFQVLTKRPERMNAYMTEARTVFAGELLGSYEHVYNAMGVVGRDTLNNRHPYRDLYPTGMPWPLPNVWLGVSAEDQARADERIPLLLDTPAAVRWVSAEPLLGPVDLEPYLSRCHAARDGDCNWPHCPQERDYQSWCRLAWDDDREMHTAATARLDWIVAGGESGPGARPMHPDWARSLRDQSAAAGVAFHFKQWGEWAPAPDGATHSLHCRPVAGSHGKIVTITDRATGKPILNRIGKKAAGRNLDGVTHDAYPTGPTHAPAQRRTA